MSKSRKKICGGTNVCCKSQKRGKQFASRKFRRKAYQLLLKGRYDSLPQKSMEVTSPWNLGGDGKRVYCWAPNGGIFERFTRK